MVLDTIFTHFNLENHSNGHFHKPNTLAIVANYHVTRKARPEGERLKTKNPAKKQD